MKEPAVPVIPPVPDGLGSLTIYLQRGTEAGLACKRDNEGTVNFLVVPRGRMGFREGHAQRFPMNDDGWAKAWSAFRAKDATAARDLASRLTVAGSARAARQRLQDVAHEDAYLTLPMAVLVGGYRVEPLAVGSSYLVQFLSDAARVVDRASAEMVLHVRYEDVIALAVDGDNTSDHRLTGGQFALAVAAEGVLTAALMSSINSQQGAATYVEMQTTAFHAVFVATGVTVTQARLALKPVHAQLRMVSRDVQGQAPVAGDDLLDRLERLQSLQQHGLLTPAEFEAAKRRILG